MKAPPHTVLTVQLARLGFGAREQPGCDDNAGVRQTTDDTKKSLAIAGSGRE